MADLEEKPRILSIDLGVKRVGVAVSDPTGTFAVGLNTILMKPKTDLLLELEKLIKDYDVEQIVMGLPKNMNGTEGPQAQKVREFTQTLSEKFNLSVTFMDERLTSVLAHQTLQEQGIQPSRHRELVDQAAAKRILQDYLDQKAMKRLD